jgi:predicted CoA-binding protein
MDFKEQGEQFLANNRRLAVYGLSRSGKATGNGIYNILKKNGYTVYPIHLLANEIDGDKCYARLQDIPTPVDGAIIVTRPDVTTQVVRDCHEAGVNNIWMHYNAFAGQSMSSVSDEAVAYCQAHGMNVIAGGCPLMFFDVAHKCMRWMLRVMGKLPTSA